MPIVNGVGYGEHTEQKQIDFEAIVSFHIDVTQRAQANWRERGWEADHDTYWYYDINAGAGYDPTGIEGSPLVFLRQAQKRRIQYRAFLIEIEPENCESLRYHIGSNSEVKIECGNHNGILPQFFGYGPARFGMLYCDPTGTTPPFELLGRMSKYNLYKRLDFLFYLHATNIKRIRRSPFTGENRNLADFLKCIDKKDWIVREPHGKEQYTFLLGSNWVDFPDWKARGFHKMRSPEGKEILDRITYTPEEIAAKNGQLMLDFS